MLKYKIVDTTVDYLRGVEIEYDFTPYEVGDVINILGIELNVHQIGSVVGLSSNSQIVVMQEVPREQND